MDMPVDHPGDEQRARKVDALRAGGRRGGGFGEGCDAAPLDINVDAPAIGKKRIGEADGRAGVCRHGINWTRRAATT
jgi:hypothetical protein